MNYDFYNVSHMKLHVIKSQFRWFQVRASETGDDNSFWLRAERDLSWGDESYDRLPASI